MLTEKKLHKIAAEVEAVEKIGLKWVVIDGKRTLTEAPVHPQVFHRDGTIFVSAEDGHLFADYYDERFGPHIDKKLEAIAKKHGCFWEWQNPGCIGLYEA